MEVVTTPQILETDRYSEEIDAILDELHEINSLPGEVMTMENIRKNRRNREALPNPQPQN